MEHDGPYVSETVAACRPDSVVVARHGGEGKHRTNDVEPEVLNLGQQKVKVCFIAQYPVRWTAQIALHYVVIPR